MEFTAEGVGCVYMCARCRSRFGNENVYFASGVCSCDDGYDGYYGLETDVPVVTGTAYKCCQSNRTDTLT